MAAKGPGNNTGSRAAPTLSYKHTSGMPVRSIAAMGRSYYTVPSPPNNRV